MEIAGLQKIDLSEIPGKLACVLYLKGCNWQCPWCFSAGFNLPSNENTIPLKQALRFLKEKQNELDAVVLNGGEPTIHKGLVKLCSKIKKLGYYIKLNTNGSNPKALQKLIDKKLVDFISMDIKAPKEKYLTTIGLEGASGNYLLSNIEKSIALLKQGAVDYGFTTTVLPSLNENDVLQIANWLRGAKKYSLRAFDNSSNLGFDFSNINLKPKQELYRIQQAVACLFDESDVK